MVVKFCGTLLLCPLVVLVNGHKALCGKIGRMFVTILMTLQSPSSRALTAPLNTWYLGLLKLNKSRNWMKDLDFPL